jgi:hypothetical protein
MNETFEKNLQEFYKSCNPPRVCLKCSQVLTHEIEWEENEIDTDSLNCDKCESSFIFYHSHALHTGQGTPEELKRYQAYKKILQREKNRVRIAERRAKLGSDPQPKNILTIKGLPAEVLQDWKELKEKTGLSATKLLELLLKNYQETC